MLSKSEEKNLMLFVLAQTAQEEKYTTRNGETKATHQSSGESCRRRGPPAPPRQPGRPEPLPHDQQRRPTQHGRK